MSYKNTNKAAMSFAYFFIKCNYEFMNNMDKELIKSISSNHHYKNPFMRNNYK